MNWTSTAKDLLIQASLALVAPIVRPRQHLTVAASQGQSKFRTATKPAIRTIAPTVNTVTFWAGLGGWSG